MTVTEGLRQARERSEGRRERERGGEEKKEGGEGRNIFLELCVLCSTN